MLVSPLQCDDHLIVTCLASVHLSLHVVEDVGGGSPEGLHLLGAAVGHGHPGEVLLGTGQVLEEWLQLVLHTIHWFHNRFSQSQRRPLLGTLTQIRDGQLEDTMLTNPPIPYDFCIGVHIYLLVLVS